jgi:hypothetical protein
MDVFYEEETGWPGDLNLHQRISAYTRIDRTTHYKVGITNDPERRASNYGAVYSQMIVVYKSSSEKNIRLMEAFLTEYIREHRQDPRCDNINEGGGGPCGDPPYFLYVVRK